MSRRFGEIRQMGYVVKDIDAAMAYWIDVLGVGPWYYVERLKVDDFRYFGEPSDPHMSIALANSGRIQLELIEQRNDAPSMYRDFINAGREGLQHVSSWPENYAEVLERALEDGIEVAQSGRTGRGDFVYLATEAFPGTVMEMAELTPTRKRQFEAIEQAAVDWDGGDPIRTVWPD
jgi:catechol 2,3-dioxygenase-like lactoylglutathione lyase family enzyme